MEYIYTSFVFIISIIEAALFYHVVCRRKFSRITYKSLFPFVGLYLAEMVCVWLNWREVQQNFLIALLYYIVGIVIMGIGWLRGVKYWVFSFVLSSTIEQIVYQVIVGKSFSIDVGYGIGNLYTSIIVTGILYVIYRICDVQVNDEKSYSIKIFRIIIPVVSMIIIGISYLTYMLQFINTKGGKILALLILFIIVLGILFIVMLVIHIFQQKENFQNQAKLENQYSQQQKAYFTMMIEKQEETKRFRHDILNHLLCIQDQLKRQHYCEVETYLEDVLSDLNIIRAMQYDVGNEIMNVWLNYYLLPIHTYCNVTIEGYLGELEHISQMDLCTIISNLLKNAVEAVDEGGEIGIYIMRKEKHVLIKIGNTCKHIPNMNKSGKFMTSKQDKESHGYGISNAQNALQKYKGELQYFIENNYIWAEISFPI